MISEAGSSTTSYFKRLGSPIAALATAAGGPLGVVRISGRSLDFLNPLIGKLEKPGTFHYRPVRIGESSSMVVDRAVVLYFQTPHSFTGEDVVEIQCHGVPAVLNAVLKECQKLGCQMALPGEFSFRAVLNSKMSLEEAEALQLAFSTEGLGVSWASKLLGIKKSADHGVAVLLREMMERLSTARGRVEAAIDFPEAEAEQESEIASAIEQVNLVEKSLGTLLTAFDEFCMSAGEFRIVIVGEPNAGKSSLLNILSGGQKALVSPIPGTTRDLVETRLRSSQGRNLRIYDTAGLRTRSHDELESAGMELGLEMAQVANLLIWVRDVSKAPDRETTSLIESLQKTTLSIFSHGDLVRSDGVTAFDFRTEQSAVRDFVSGKIEEILEQLIDRPVNPSTSLISSRQGQLLELALSELQQAKSSLLGYKPLELAASDLRNCEGSLRKALGQEVSEDYIGEIFRQFCLGK